MKEFKYGVYSFSKNTYQKEINKLKLATNTSSMASATKGKCFILSPVLPKQTKWSRSASSLLYFAFKLFPQVLDLWRRAKRNKRRLPTLFIFLKKTREIKHRKMFSKITSWASITCQVKPKAHPHPATTQRSPLKRSKLYRICWTYKFPQTTTRLNISVQSLKKIFNKCWLTIVISNVKV